jgi:hypothetical protein
MEGQSVIEDNIDEVGAGSDVEEEEDIMSDKSDEEEEE